MGLDTPSHEMLTIAEAFVTARREGRGLPAFPGAVPADLTAGYGVQDAAVALRGAPIGGWKVGRISPPLGGVERLAGPIFAETIVTAGETPPAMPVFAEGFAAVEAEYLLRIGAAPEPGKAEFTRDEAMALIDAVHVGLEVASSPFPGINDHGATVTISDFGNNNGLVVGAALNGWRTRDFEAWPVRLAVNGETVGTGTAAAMLDGPFGAARFLLELMARRGIALEAGQWISSGAITGVHRVGIGDHVEAWFDGGRRVECIIKAS